MTDLRIIRVQRRSLLIQYLKNNTNSIFRSQKRIIISNIQGWKLLHHYCLQFAVKMLHTTNDILRSHHLTPTEYRKGYDLQHQANTLSTYFLSQITNNIMSCTVLQSNERHEVTKPKTLFAILFHNRVMNQSGNFQKSYPSCS